VRGNESSRVRLLPLSAASALPEGSTRQKSPTVAGESEEKSLIQSHPEESDVFELLDSVVIEVLAPEVRLAANVIAHLYKLPANLRSLVYGFITHGNNESGSSNSAPGHAESGTDSQQIFPIAKQPDKKRKGNQDGDDESGDQKPRDTRNRSRAYSKARVLKLKYACPFNIKDSARYCVINKVGGTGELYRSCMGTGWTELRGLL
jgi:hypothetical protein